MELAGHEFQGIPHHIIADYGDFGRIWAGTQRRQIGGNGLEGQARKMTYRGFSIESEPYTIESLYYGEAVAIRFFGELAAYADSIPLAKRAIDAHMEAGIWPPKAKEG